MSKTPERMARVEAKLDAILRGDRADWDRALSKLRDDIRLEMKPRLCDVDYVDAYSCRSKACRKSGTCTGAKDSATYAE